MSFGKNPYTMEPPRRQSKSQLRLDEVKSKLTPPAICLIIFSATTLLLLIVLVLFIVIALIAQSQSQKPARAEVALSAIAQISTLLVYFIIQIIMICGGVAMLKRKNYELAKAGAILACLPLCSSCCVFGIPVGIWSVIVLNMPDVRASFRD